MSWNPMTLGSYAFERDPDTCTVPKKARYTSMVKTYGSAVFFSWGLFIEGVEIEMTWKLMSETMFNALQVLLEADAEIVWDRQSGISGTNYNVELQSLEGSYVETSLLHAPYRQDVRLRMVITSEAS